MSKKWADPLDKLLAADHEASSVSEHIKKAKKERGNSIANTLAPNSEWEKKINPSDKPTEITHNDTYNHIYEISTTDIINWDFHDRPEAELGDISALAKDFLNIGQQQPCIVRPIVNDSGNQEKYELIVGERRWRAAQSVNLLLKVIVKDLTDNEAALIQATENDNRKDLSDFAKGMSFSRLIEKGIIKQKDLTERLGKSKQYVSALLSYSKIPEDIKLSFGSLSTISASTAEKIKQLSCKGEGYISALIQVGNKYRGKSPGPKVIAKEVENIIFKKELKKDLNSKVLTENGRHVFTWRKDNNDLPSIHFPKQIGRLILNSKIDLDRFSYEVMEIIEEKLETLKTKKSG